MEKIKLKSILVLWSVAGLIAIAVLWFLPWRFDSNDDVIMMWLVSGAYTGEPESYALFIHPFLSHGLASLYNAFPSINWYSLVWFTTLFLSYLAIVVSVTNSPLQRKWQHLILFFLLILWVHFALILQFTVVAGVSAFSGLLLLSNSKRSSFKISSFFGLLLITIAFLIRWESFVLIYLGYALYQLLFTDSWKSLKPNIPSYYIFLICFTSFISDYYFTSTSEYGKFKRYTKARSSVFDHPTFFRMTIDDELARGSEWFYFSLSLMDGNEIDVNALESKKAELDNSIYGFHKIGDSFFRLKQILAFQNFKLAFSIILLICYFWIFHRFWRNIFFCIFWLSFMLVFNHFFVIKAYVYILFFLPLLFPIILNSKIPKVRLYIVYIMYIILSGLFIYHLKNFSQDIEKRKLISKAFLLSTSNLPEGKLFVFEGYQQNLLPINYSKDCVVPYLSTGWISKSPFQKKKLQSMGLTQISDAKEFYLLGVDVNDEYFFPEYMNYLSGDFVLANKTEVENLILFHYIKSY